MSILFSRNYTLKRISNTGRYDKSGKYIEGSLTPLLIKADIQPVTGKELESLNIGRDNLGKVKVYTDEILNIAVPGSDGTNLQNGDKVVFDGNDYEIIQKMKNEGGLIPHKKYIGELRV